MNRLIAIDSLLALAAILVLGPGTSILVQLAVRQACAGMAESAKVIALYLNSQMQD